MHPDDHKMIEARERYLGWSIENPGVKRHLIKERDGRAISACRSSNVGRFAEHLPNPYGPLYCARCLRSFQRTR